jgi:hypothetical protein
MLCLLFAFWHREQDDIPYYPTYSCRSKVLPVPELDTCKGLPAKDYPAAKPAGAELAGQGKLI